MTINEIIKIVNGDTKLNSDKQIKSIKTNSKDVRPGDIFIAIKGKNYDGHDFILEALDNGAIACISEQNINDKCIKVSSTIDSMFSITNYIRNQYNIPLIAITGSNGKTTTKDLLYHVLSSKYKVLKNSGSKNNIIGVSETLFNLDNSYDIITIELGTNHVGEISKLSLMCNPNLSLITNIGTAHLGYFKKLKNTFKEKLSIVDGMYNKKLIVNGDDKYLKKLKCFKCGKHKNNDLKAYNIEGFIDHITFNIFLDKEYKIEFNNPGTHFVNNILLVIKACLDYGININKIIDKIRTFSLTNMRMNILRIGSNTIINDCYNSSLESISAGIDYLKEIGSNKVLIIGDILELGKHSKRIHKKINKKLNKLKNRVVYTVGKHSKIINGTHFEDVEDLLAYIKDINFSNSFIYIKGSRGMHLEKVLEHLKK